MIRARMIAVRAAVSQREDKQSRLTARLLDLTKDARTVFCYVSMGSEVDTHAFIHAAAIRQTVLVPHTHADFSMTAVAPIGDLRPDRMGNVEGRPDTREIDVAIVPLLAFNERLYRIGYGKGCYDRWLIGRKVTTVGLAFDEQSVDFEAEPHDCALDCVLTPTKLYTR